MESNDLGSKKTNNKQNKNEGFSGEKLPEDYNNAASILKEKIELLVVPEEKLKM